MIIPMAYLNLLGIELYVTDSVRVAGCPPFGGQVLLFWSLSPYCPPKKNFFKGVFALKNDLFPFCPPFLEVFIEKS